LAPDHDDVSDTILVVIVAVRVNPITGNCDRLGCNNDEDCSTDQMNRHSSVTENGLDRPVAVECCESIIFVFPQRSLASTKAGFTLAFSSLFLSILDESLSSKGIASCQFTPFRNIHHGALPGDKMVELSWRGGGGAYLTKLQLEIHFLDFLQGRKL